MMLYVKAVHGRLLLPLLLAGATSSRYQLPPSASIRVQKVILGKNVSQSDRKVCLSDYVTPARVRHMFQTYHEITDEIHDGYQWFDCSTQGSITIGGKHFYWEAQPGNTLNTTYPDGKGHMLGGAHSDDMSGEDFKWSRDY